MLHPIQRGRCPTANALLRRGGSGAAVYGERKLEFEKCLFTDNEATIDAAAVMVSRSGTFRECTFRGNAATYAGAVRVSGILKSAVQPEVAGFGARPGVDVPTMVPQAAHLGLAFAMPSPTTDIGDCILEDCVFHGNHGIKKGGGPPPFLPFC